MKTELKLKRWVKVVFMVIVGLFLFWLIDSTIKQNEELARKCDLEKGYTCSYYEIRKYSIRG